jgi:hypothetical protein
MYAGVVLDPFVSLTPGDGPGWWRWRWRWRWRVTVLRAVPCFQCTISHSQALSKTYLTLLEGLTQDDSLLCPQLKETAPDDWCGMVEAVTAALGQLRLALPTIDQVQQVLAEQQQQA